MKTVYTLSELHASLAGLRASGKRIAFVPTMGALHAGHLSLIDTAKQYADAVVVSIFVNPTQFAAHEDLGSYPRTLEADAALLENADVAVLFAPSDADIYPDNIAADVQLDAKADILCGNSRPHFFHGVATVVKRLLEAVSPNVAVFGEKDYQQLWLIKRMVKELGMSTEIVGSPLKREEDGLALSSRNRYLSPEERNLAPQLYKAMVTIHASPFNPKTLQQAWDTLTANGFVMDYLEWRYEENLERVQEPTQKPMRLFAAAMLGKTRLIDNISKH